MCIAILKNEGLKLSKETLAQCFKANSDGAGFLYKEDGRLKISKGFFKFDNFYKSYLKHEDKQMLIHFRIKTHGAVAAENCHPFFVNKDIGFIHNGIISQHSGNTGVSDTRDFNTNILKPLVAKHGTTIMFEPAIKRMIEDYIGYSKLVFLDVNGNWSIFNENKGVWDEGIWYSNTTYKVPEPYVSTFRNLPITKYQSKYNTKEDSQYYLPRGDERIEELDRVRVRHTFNGISAGSIVRVLYISSYGMTDIELANGTIIPNFPGLHLEPLQKAIANLFDDSFNDNLIANGFHDTGIYTGD